MNDETRDYVIKPIYKWHLLHNKSVEDGQIHDVLLQNHGIDDPEDFFNMGEADFRDPRLLHDVIPAKERIRSAIAKDEKIMVFGDYDCDGITAISVLVRAFEKYGCSIDYDLPDRFEEGYGLNDRAVRDIIEKKYDLIITVDNGITSIKEIDALNRAGIDCIITDHHEPKTELPNAFAIVHPALNGDGFRDIAGVMVAYKLVSVVFGDVFPELFDLVMMGTVADMMPLIDENRAMVNEGIETIQESRNPGMRALLDVAGIHEPGIKDLSFLLAPRINSAGRMGKAEEAVRLFLSDDPNVVQKQIKIIESLHQERKTLTDEATGIARDLVNKEDDVIVVASPLFHEGVIGICAQKLVEEFQKSTLVIALDDEDIGKGSMRSFGEENVLSMLEKQKDLLMRFGGHKQACGMKIRSGDIPELRQRLNHAYVREEEPLLNVDMTINPDHLSLDTAEKVSGGAFHAGLFMLKDMRVTNKRSLSNKHTKLSIQKNGRPFEALDFNRMRYFWLLDSGDTIDLIVHISVNEWRGRKSVQFIIKDAACHHRQWLDFRDEMVYYQGMSHLSDDSLLINDDLYLLDDFVERMSGHLPQTICFVPNTNQFHLHRIKDKNLFVRAYTLFNKDQSMTEKKLSKALGEHMWLAREIIRVFKELNFIESDDNGWHLRDQPEKRPLKTSKRYKQLKALTRFVVWYDKAPKNDLVAYFKTLLEEKS